MNQTCATYKDLSLRDLVEPSVTARKKKQRVGARAKLGFPLVFKARVSVGGGRGVVVGVVVVRAVGPMVVVGRPWRWGGVGDGVVGVAVVVVVAWWQWRGWWHGSELAVVGASGGGGYGSRDGGGGGGSDDVGGGRGGGGVVVGVAVVGAVGLAVSISIPLELPGWADYKCATSLDSQRIVEADPLRPVLSRLKYRYKFAAGVRPSSGVKHLGGGVSRDADFISGLAIRRAANAGLAFVAPRAQYWVLQDHILRDSGICGKDGDYVSALACLHDTIPSFNFSCFTNKDTAPSKAQQTLVNVLFSEMVKDMKVHFDMTMRQKAVECMRASHTQDFLLAIHIDSLGQHMSQMEYRIILKYRLLIPLFLVDAICLVCRKTCLDSFEKYTVNCE
ncbi:hypothetical protein Tco_0427968 [Tanacetum coccineum]